MNTWNGIANRTRGVIAVLALLLGAALLVWGLRSIKRGMHVLQISASQMRASLEATDGAAVAAHRLPDYALVLEYPQELRLGDSQLVRLRIVPSPGSAKEGVAAHADPTGPTGVPGLKGQDVPLAFQARLELTGASVRPEGEITVPLISGQESDFIWNVLAVPGDTARGTAWTLVVPLNSSDLLGERTAIAAQSLEMPKTTILGLTGPASRVTGTVLVLLAAALGMPWIDRLLRLLTRRERARAQ